jgi:hypothetical protein
MFFGAKAPNSEFGFWLCVVVISAMEWIVIAGLLWMMDGIGQDTGLSFGNASVRDHDIFHPHHHELRAKQSFMVQVDIRVSPNVGSIVIGLCKSAAVVMYLSVALIWRLLTIVVMRPTFVCSLLALVVLLDRCSQDSPDDENEYPNMQ